MRRLTLFLLTTVLLISLAATAVSALQVHIVQRGENLYQIARRYDRTVEELARANGISPPYLIHAGNEITIPARLGVTPAPAQTPNAPTTSEETHCYIIGDDCVIISNACFLNWWPDCGDGSTWESQYRWKQGWCAAAIYAGVIVGTIDDCAQSRAQTVAEKALISSIYRMSAQQKQRQQSSSGGDQQQQGGNQQSSSGGDQQQQSGNQQPQQQPPQQLFSPIQQQQNTQKTVVQQQLPQQTSQGPQGEQGGGQTSNTLPDCQLDPRYKTERYLQVPCNQPNPKDLRVDRSGTVSGDGNVRKPTYTPRVPASGRCRGSKHDCFNCNWQRQQTFGSKAKTQTLSVCKVKGEDPCTAYEDITVNISDTPSKTTWRYVCS